MIDVLPRSHAAIFDRPQRKIPPSLLLAILVAVGLHAVLVFYLIAQNFTPAAQPDETKIDDPITIIMDPPTQTKTPAPTKPNVIPVHTPVQVVDNTETTTIIPVKGPDVVIDTGPPVLPSDSGQGTSLDTGTDTGPVFVNPSWTSFPDANALSDYYPDAALTDDRTGQASVECTVLDTAGHISCVLVSETPKGYGFGSATVRVVQDKGRVDTDHGAVKPGSKLRATLQWKLADS